MSAADQQSEKARKLLVKHPGHKSVLETAYDAQETATLGMQCTLSSQEYRDQSKAAYEAWCLVIAILGEEP